VHTYYRVLVSYTKTLVKQELRAFKPDLSEHNATFECLCSSGSFLILYHGYNLRRKCHAVLKRRLFFRKVFELCFDYQ